MDRFRFFFCLCEPLTAKGCNLMVVYLKASLQVVFLALLGRASRMMSLCLEHGFQPAHPSSFPREHRTVLLCCKFNDVTPHGRDERIQCRRRKFSVNVEVHQSVVLVGQFCDVLRWRSEAPYGDIMGWKSRAIQPCKSICVASSCRMAYFGLRFQTVQGNLMNQRCRVGGEVRNNHQLAPLFCWDWVSGCGGPG